MIIFSHRGFSSKYFQNTIKAIQQAVLIESDGIEFDVQLSKDNVPIIYHDFSLKKLLGIKKSISEINYKELKKIKLPDNQYIPTLEEVLSVIPKNVIINIELKGKNTAFFVFGILEKYNKSGRISKKNIIVSSFNHSELKKFREYDKGEYKLGVIVSGLPLGIIKFSKQLNAYCINPSMDFITEKFVKKIHKKGFKTFVWVVNSYKDYLKATHLGVDGIFTDFPNIFKNL